MEPYLRGSASGSLEEELRLSVAVRGEGCGARWAEAAVDSPFVSSRDGPRGRPAGRDLGRQGL